jgi:molybdate/tungstate transport system substrate-binding protein
MEIRGKSCTYGVTLINNAPNREGAIAFLQYLLDPEYGLRTLRDMGQPPFVPCRVPTAKMRALIPTELQNLVKVKD